MNKKRKTIFWDYDIEKIDFSKPAAKIWYLTRKLQFGDFSDIKKNELKKFLPKLNINPSLKELLRNFLKTNAQ